MKIVKVKNINGKIIGNSGESDKIVNYPQAQEGLNLNQVVTYRKWNWIDCGKDQEGLGYYSCPIMIIFQIIKIDFNKDSVIKRKDDLL